MNWRNLGDISVSAFTRELKGTPLEADAARIYNAVSPYGILFLAHLFVESGYGVSDLAKSKRNIVGLRPRGGGDGFMSFSTYLDSAKEWKSRVSSSTYAYAKTRTVEEYIHTYAPSSDGNNEAEYVATIERFAQRLGEGMVITFGKVKKPVMTEMIVDKPWEGAGFDRVAPRKIVGTCNHRTEGRDTPQSVHNLFATGGERQADALTDYVIGLDGVIGHLNNENGTRAGWANGGSDGLEGDGPNFVKTFGTIGINSRLVSIEHCGLGTDPLSSAQFDASARLNAWIFDQCKVPWDTFPINPAFGIVTQLEHWEFATKGCPGSQFRNRTTELHERIRGYLKAAQLSVEPVPTPPPSPIEPGHGSYPEGMNFTKATKLYGTVVKHRINGSTEEFPFNPNSSVCLAWMKRGGKENIYPEGDSWFQFIDESKNQREFITFKNGWILFRPSDRAAFTWL